MEERSLDTNGQVLEKIVYVGKFLKIMPGEMERMTVNWEQKSSRNEGIWCRNQEITNKVVGRFGE